MTNHEITAEVLSEQKKLTGTKERLIDEYDRERKKLKIGKREIYPRAYHVKTARKNTCIIFIQKHSLCNSYRNQAHSMSGSIVYFFDGKQYRVFRETASTGILEVFNGHLFTRFRERLHLDIANPVEVIERFFNYNGFIQSKYTNKEGVENNRTIATCLEGFLLGKRHPDCDWIEHKTFVSHDMKRSYQKKYEESVKQKLSAQLMLDDCWFGKPLSKSEIFYNMQYLNTVTGTQRWKRAM